jgi:hypothetical protein
MRRIPIGHEGNWRDRSLFYVPDKTAGVQEIGHPKGFGRKLIFMGNYELFLKGKSTEDILAHTVASDQGPLGEYMRVAAQVRVSQGQIEAQYNATKHLVDCANALVASQGTATKVLVESIDRLERSINGASEDSGRLALRIAILTLFLVIVGAGQIIATGWPYLAYWWHH